MIAYPPPIDHSAFSVDVSPMFEIRAYKTNRTTLITNTDAPFIVKRVSINNSEVLKELAINEKEYREYTDMVNTAPWIKTLFKELKDLNDPILLFPYYKHIQSLIRGKNYDTFSTLLTLIAIEQVDEVLIIGLLRLTNPWKSRIASWNDFLDKAHIELDSRGHSGNELLRGLS